MQARFVPIEFPNEFLAEDEKTIEGLADTILAAEANAILNFQLRCAHDELISPYPMPLEIAQLKGEILTSENDLAGFIKEECVAGPKCGVQYKAFADKFRQYQLNKGVKSNNLLRDDVIRKRLKSMGFGPSSKRIDKTLEGVMRGRTDVIVGFRLLHAGEIAKRQKDLRDTMALLDKSEDYEDTMESTGLRRFTGLSDSIGIQN
jgi:phage/plasmid-associated DNA primase